MGTGLVRGHVWPRLMEQRGGGSRWFLGSPGRAHFIGRLPGGLGLGPESRTRTEGGVLSPMSPWRPALAPLCPTPAVTLH